VPGWLRRRFAEPDISKYVLRRLDEVIIDEVHRHWVVYGRAVVEALFGLAFVVMLPFTSVQIGWLSILVATGLFVHAGWLALNEHMERFVVTNLRVYRVRGVVSKSFATMPLRRILDITVHEPLLGRLVGYGHFVFENAAQEQGLREIRFVGDPNVRLNEIQREVLQRDPRSPSAS